MFPFHSLILALLLLATVALGQAPADSSPAGPTLPGTASNCNRWYKIKKGDTCESVQELFKIAAKDFLAWNPDVSSDCIKNFWVDNAYCVGVGPGSPSSGSPSPSPSIPVTSSSDKTSLPPASASSSYAVSAPSSPSSGLTEATSYTFNHPITSQTLTPFTPSPTDDSWPPKKTQAGQPKDCYKWHLVKYGDTCKRIKALYSLITLEDLMNWNPELAADCDYPFAGWWVCVGVKTDPFTFRIPTPGPVSLPETTAWTPSSKSRWPYTGAGADSANVTLPTPWTVHATPTASVQANTTKDCRAWYQVDRYETCQDVVDLFGTFSLKEFIAWNPTLGDKCTGIQNWYWYCVAVPGTPASRTAPAPSYPLPTDHGPQPGQPANCNRWWWVSRRNQDCYMISIWNNISLDDFHKWNPAVNYPRCDNLVQDSQVCVGVANNQTTTPGSWPPNSTAPPRPPYPTGMNHTGHTSMASSSRFPPMFPSAPSAPTWTRSSTWIPSPSFTTSYGAPSSTPWPSLSTVTSCSDESTTSYQHWTSTGINAGTSRSSAKTVTIPSVSITVPSPTIIATTPCNSTDTDDDWTTSTDTDEDWPTSTRIDMSTPWSSASTAAVPSVSMPVADPTMIVTTPCKSTGMSSVTSPSWTDTVIGGHPGSVSRPMPSVTTVCPHDKDTHPHGCVPPSMTPISSQDGIMTVTVTTTTTIICDTRVDY